MADWSSFPAVEGKASPWDAFPRSDAPAPQPASAAQVAPQEPQQAGLWSRMLQDFENVGPAAQQGVHPDVGALGKHLVSDRTTIDEEGNLLYVDPKTGALVPTNRNTQVNMVDPADKRMKVYARTPDTAAGPAEGLTRLVTQGMATGPVTMRPGLATAVQANRPQVQKAMTTEGLFDRADTLYERARANPTRFPPEALPTIAEDTTQGLRAQGFRDYLNPKTFRAIEELKTETPDVTGADSVRKALNIAARDPSERAASRQAVNAIDEFVAPKVPEIAAARAYYAAGSRAETIQEALDKAQRAAGAANSGQNFDNALRAQVKTIRNSDKLRRGFDAEELAQMDKIIEGNFAGNAVRYMANLAGKGGGIGAAITGAMTKGVAPVVGYGLNKIASAMTKGQFSKLDEMVRARVPEGRGTQAALTEWSKAVDIAEKSPVPRTIAQLTLATKNLATNLKDVGISISPEDIFRSIAGPMQGRTQDEQTVPPGPINE